MSTYSVLLKFGAWARPISGKLIQLSILEFRGLTQTVSWKLRIWTGSPEIGPAHAPIFYKNWIIKFAWMSFPEIGLCKVPQNWNFGRKSGWVFQDSPIRVKWCAIINIKFLVKGQVSWAHSYKAKILLVWAYRWIRQWNSLKKKRKLIIYINYVSVFNFILYSRSMIGRERHLGWASTWKSQNWIFRI